VDEVAKCAAVENLDYVILGSIFPTPTHPNATPLGLKNLKKAAQSKRRLGLIAIGGITATNAPTVMRAGADGIAVIRAVFHTPNPQQAVFDLAKAVNL
jgi:thiamine-phosphate pyrophosphorylase